jgi:hypothetical protein
MSGSRCWESADAFSRSAWKPAGGGMGCVCRRSGEQRGEAVNQAGVAVLLQGWGNAHPLSTAPTPVGSV